jgi:hypothetical protein
MTFSSQKHPEHEVAPPIKNNPESVDPCAGRMRFGRRMYFFSSLAGICLWGAMSGFLSGSLSVKTSAHGWLPEKVMDLMPLLSLIILPACIFGPAFLRARDLGMSGWNALLLLCPIVNLFIGYNLAFAPRGYAITRKADAFQRAVKWVLLGLLALIGIFLMVQIIAKR